MAKTWHHPDFGEFTFKEYAWTISVDMPAFAVFGYTPRYSDDRPTSGKCELRVEEEREPDGELLVPSTEVLALVSKVLANQAFLVPAVAGALWDDFNGRGPRSGMWWHGHLEEVVDDVDPSLPPLDCPEALFSWLRLSGIRTRKDGSRNKEPLVELSFDAPFEEEHGVGVLTDGNDIVGTGYSGSVRRFREQ